MRHKPTLTRVESVITRASPFLWAQEMGGISNDIGAKKKCDAYAVLVRTYVVLTQRTSTLLAAANFVATLLHQEQRC